MKTARNEEKGRSRVLVAKVERSHGYITVNLDFATMADSLNMNSLRYPSIDSWAPFEDAGEWTHPLKPEDTGSLTIRAQANIDKPGEALYGIELGYRDVYCARLHHAERMVKTLKYIHKGLDRLRDRFGDALKFEDFVARVADVTGCTHLVIPEQTSVRRAEMSTDGERIYPKAYEGAAWLAWNIWTPEERERAKQNAA